MTLKQIEKEKERAFGKAGEQVHKLLTDRARELLVQINRQYPEVKGVFTGMGLGSFEGSFKVPAVYSDGSEGEINEDDLWEWADWGNKIYEPAGMTPKLKEAFVELVAICAVIQDENYIPNLSVSI